MIESKVIRIGDSIGMIIPSDYVKKYKVKPNDVVNYEIHSMVTFTKLVGKRRIVKESK